MIPARSVFGLHNVITPAHLDKIAKMLLLTGWIVTYSYVLELFIAWYSGDVFEVYQYWVARTTGPGAALFWIMIFANVVVPQLFWWRSMRVNGVALFVASLPISVGMWAERFVIIVLGLQRGFLPSSWRAYAPTWVDLAILSGTLCFFSLLFMLFLRLVPFIPIVGAEAIPPRARPRGPQASGGAMTRLMAELADPEAVLGAIAALRERTCACSTCTRPIRSARSKPRSRSNARGSHTSRVRARCSAVRRPTRCSGG